MDTINVYIEKSECGYTAYMAEEIDHLGYSILGEGETINDATADFLDSYHEIQEYCTLRGESFREARFSFHCDTI